MPTSGTWATSLKSSAKVVRSHSASRVPGADTLFYLAKGTVQYRVYWKGGRGSYMCVAIQKVVCSHPWRGILYVVISRHVFRHDGHGMAAL